MKISAVLLLAALSWPAFAGDEAAGTQAANARNSIRAVQHLLEERPRDPTLWFYLARFQAEAGDTRACVASLEKVYALGDGFLPVRELGFERAWSDPAFQAVRAKLEARLPRLDFAPTTFELDDRGLLPEGIAHDEHSGNFFVGSVAEHKILRVDSFNAVSPFAGAPAGLDSVLGLAVDGPRRILYAVSTSALTDEGAKHRRNAVYAFDVETARLLRRVEGHQAVQLNDVTVALGGRVYASDSGSGAVYEIPAEGAARAVLEAGTVRGSNGIAASPDGKRLYVAHSTGIVVVDLVDGKVTRVAVPPRQTVAALDGLYQWQGKLIGVQNVTNPGRVILMTLDHDGTAITRVQTLLSHHHTALDEPTTGAVSGNDFYLLASTGGISRYDRQGRVEHPEALRNPLVVRIPLP
jgi:hypothetical protein